MGPVILLGAMVALALPPAPARAAGGALTADNVTVSEPDGGARAVVFAVTLARTDGDAVTVDYATVDGTATAGQDYVPTRGTLDFGPAGTTRTVRVEVLGDDIDEPDETFVLRLSGASTGQTPVEATATILDSDAPPLLAVDHAQVTEGDGTAVDAVFAVSLSAASGLPVTVDYATADGTATAPADVTATAGTLTFNPGERLKTVAVPVAGDAADEPTETFTLVLSNPSGATIGDGAGAGTGTILDNDGPPALSVEDATAGEQSRILTFTVTLDRPSSETVTFRAQTADAAEPNAARTPDDYVALSSTPIQIPAGETSVAVDVPLTDDQVHEGPETLRLELSGETNATLARPVATGTITDDDPGPDLSVADAAATEGTLVGDSLVFTVSLSAPAGTVLTVDYATADGTAVAEAAAPDEPDYTAATGTLTFQPTQTSKTVVVLVNHDTHAEGDETVLLRLSNPSPGVGLARHTATGTIQNDDGPADELSVTSITAVEGDRGTAAHLFVVTRVRRSTEPRSSWEPVLPVTVGFATRGGTAEPGSDYTPRRGVLTFSGSVTTQTISLSVLGDTVDEDDETVILALFNPTNAVLGSGTATATIRDDDQPPVVSVVPATVGEGHSTASRGAAEVVLAAPSSRPVTVAFAVGGGSASPADYLPDAPNGTLVFPPGETVRTVGFRVLGDAVDEPDETFGVTLTAVEGGRFADGAPVATALVTIADDDEPPALIARGGTITETDAARRPLEFAVVLGAVSGQAVSVTVATADGPAAPSAPADGPASGGPTIDGPASGGAASHGSAPGGATAPADYTPISAGAVVTIPAGQRAVTVPVTVTDDGDPDGAPSEVFTLNLSAPLHATLAAASATGTILDDDGPPTLSIAADDGPEGNGPAGPAGVARFVVTLSKPSEEPVSVTGATGADSDTATAGDDYTPARTGLTFQPGETAKFLDVPLTGDGVDEPDETLTVQLTDPAGGAVLDPGRSAATATIVDDDGPTLSVQGGELPEGHTGVTTATFTVLLSSEAAQPVTVRWATANGTATGGRDYTPAAGTLEFPPGETIRTVSVAVAGDTLSEGAEDLLLTLGGATGATLTAGFARAVIADDDLPRLDITDAGVVEGDTGTADLAFTVTLTPPAPVPVTVALTSRDGTAAAGADFDPVDRAVILAPGERARTVLVPVRSDTTDTTTETFTLALSAAGPGARVGRDAATGTILDDDGPPGIFAPDIRVTEPTGEDGTATFTVRLSGPRSFPVAVRYETVDGSRPAATPDLDFTPVAGALTFAPGEEEKPVAVPVRGDSLFEAGETIRLRLTAPQAGTVSDPEAEATIVDDDGPAYLLASADGGIFTYGSADFLGSAGAVPLKSPIVSLTRHPSGRGYWLGASDGGVFAFGDARFHGSAGRLRLKRPIVDMAATPSGNGYWLVASDGGIFAFGDARFFGSPSGTRLRKPIVGMAPTPSGQGYWLVATDGGIFAYGDAAFHGSTGATALNRPIVGMAPTPSGQGYWLVATDGGIFAYGDAAFHGSTGGRRLNRPIVGMAPTPSGQGYWLVASDGGIFAYGDAPFLGSTGAHSLNRPVVAAVTL